MFVLFEEVLYDSSKNYDKTVQNGRNQNSKNSKKVKEASKRTSTYMFTQVG